MSSSSCVLKLTSHCTYSLSSPISCVTAFIFHFVFGSLTAVSHLVIHLLAKKLWNTTGRSWFSCWWSVEATSNKQRLKISFRFHSGSPESSDILRKYKSIKFFVCSFCFILTLSQTFKLCKWIRWVQWILGNPEATEEIQHAGNFCSVSNCEQNTSSFWQENCCLMLTHQPTGGFYWITEILCDCYGLPSMPW